MNNKYFILRHGQTIHQTKKKLTLYCWPDDNPLCNLTEVGVKQVEKSVQALKDAKIDLIFSSDILRTRQTSGMAAKELNLEVNFDERLRDINWGIYQGKSKIRGWAYYKNPGAKFTKAPPEGESWAGCAKRVVEFLTEVEGKYSGKNILIVSHGDPLWLLEGYARGYSQNQLLKQKITGKVMKTGELRRLN